MMVSRSLFEVFQLMRNNALQSRHLYDSSRKKKKRSVLSEDRVALVSDPGDDHYDDDEDISYAEQVGTALRYRRLQNLPPEWTETIDEVNNQIRLIEKKVKDLKAAHDRVIRRPAFDDDEKDTSRELDAVTNEITQMFQSCQQQIGVITRQQKRATTKAERKLAENAALRLNRALQEVSVEFKVAQVSYLKRMFCTSINN